MQKAKFPHFFLGLYGLLPAICCLVRGLSDRLYTDIDSFLVSITCAGLYSKDTVCPVVHPLLGIVIGRISSLWPNADWFSLLSQAFVLVGIWWLGTLMAVCLSQPAKRLTCLLAFSLILLQLSLFNINYTVWSGFFACVGGCTLFLSLRRPLPRISHILAPLFLFLSVLWRPESAALLLPFIVLDLAVMVFSRRVTPSQLWRAILPSAVGIALLGIFILGFFTAFPARQTAEAYSSARRALVDYPHKEWTEVCGALTSLGLSENDYNALTSGLLLDTRVVTASLLQEVAAAAHFNIPLSPEQWFAEPLRVVSQAFSTPLLRILSSTVFLLFLVVLASRTSLPEKIETGLALGGSLLICVYYGIVGRLPERVIACVLLALLSVLFSLFLCAPTRSIRFAYRLWNACCVITGCVFLLYLWKNHYQYHILQPAWEARQPSVQEDTGLPEESDAVYLWHPMTLALYMTDHYMEEGKLPSKTFVQQNLACGEWNTSGQPCMEQLLSALQMENPMQSLLTRPHTYLISNDTKLVETWLQEHYDPQATLIQTGNVVEVFAAGEVPIWTAIH